MTRSIILLLISTVVGCSFLKDKTGEYVTEAVVESLEQKFDERLKQRDLSIAELKKVVDENADGQITQAEVVTTAKEMAMDYVSLRLEGFEAKKKAELTEATQRLIERFTADGRQRQEEEKQALLAEVSRLEREHKESQETFALRMRAGLVTPDEFNEFKTAQAAHEDKLNETKAELAAQSKSSLWELILSLAGLMVAYLLKQVWGASKHGETKAALARTETRIDFLEKLTGRDLDQNGLIGGEPVPTA